jgi:hypothetical protein
MGVKIAAAALLLFVSGIGILNARFKDSNTKVVFYAIRILISWILPFPKQYRSILEKNFLYYRQLPAYRRFRFEKRVQRFIIEKDFVSRGGLEITDTMKVLVAACAVQLTFGFSPIYLTHFKTIILYPDKYYSLINQVYHKGEVNEGGLIVLSWKHFQEGYQYPNDSLNLGLHEMAHALLLENETPDEEYHFLDPEHYQQFFEVAEMEYQRIHQGEASLLRKYAGANQAEFFAVAVETFFEKPQVMQKELPNLYNSLANLLKQNPLYYRQWA